MLTDTFRSSKPSDEDGLTSKSGPATDVHSRLFQGGLSAGTERSPAVRFRHLISILFYHSSFIFRTHRLRLPQHLYLRPAVSSSPPLTSSFIREINATPTTVSFPLFPFFRCPPTARRLAQDLVIFRPSKASSTLFGRVVQDISLKSSASATRSGFARRPTRHKITLRA